MERREVKALKGDRKKVFTRINQWNNTTCKAIYYQDGDHYEVDDVLFSVKGSPYAVLIVYKDLVEFIKEAEAKIPGFKRTDKLRAEGKMNRTGRPKKGAYDNDEGESK